MTRRRISTLLCMLILGTGGVAEAQQTPAVQNQEPVIAVPTKDLFDLIRDLRHKPAPPPPGPDAYKERMIAAAPVITYNPTGGVGIGVAGNVAFYQGAPEKTRISSVVASLVATSKSQVLINAKMNTYAGENRWHMEADNRLYWTSQKTYGLGTDTQQDDGVDQKFDTFRFYDTLYRRLGRYSYLGTGLLYSIHREVEPIDDAASEAWPDSPYVTYSEKHGFDPVSQASGGFSLRGLLDSRDNPINPARGWYANAAYLMFFKDFLGGSSDWQQFSYDLRGYARISKDARHKVGVWLLGDFVTGGTAPYLDLPATGMDIYGRSGRGYPQGRFRGEDLVYGEAEYRWTATENGLFGMVAFVNTQTLSSSETGEHLFDSFAPGGGFGFRLMLNKRSRTNLCFDIGFGKDGSRAAYFAVQEAF